MCLVLLDYYPRNRFLEQECMSVVDRSTIPLVLGASAVLDARNPDTAVIVDAQGMSAAYIVIVARGLLFETKMQTQYHELPDRMATSIS